MALRGENACKAESAFLSFTGCATLFNESTTTGFVKVSFFCCAKADCTQQIMMKTASHRHCIRNKNESLINGNVHLIQQFIQLLQRIIIKCDHATAILAVLYFYLSAEMRSQLVFDLLVRSGKIVGCSGFL